MTSQAVRPRTAIGAAAIACHPLAWVAVVALGVVLRALAAFPSFRSPLQSDAALLGLTAFEILRGDAQVFLCNGTRLGALESYLHAAVFALFGVSRATLYVAPQLTGIALLAAFAALARELLGPKTGLLALLLVAIPPPMVLLWSILPTSYPETLFLIVLTLACAARIARRGPAPLPLLGLGLAAGLGWWGSALSLAGTVPAVLWIALHRPAIWRQGRAMILAAAGFLVGALPWIAINLRYPLISFRQGAGTQGNFAFAAADGLDQLLNNTARLGDRLFGLLLRADGERPAALLAAVALAGALHVAALLVAVLQVVRTRAAEEGARRISPLLLPLLVAGCTGAFFVLSAAGGLTGDTVRYILPIAPAAALLLAALLGRIAARSRAGAAAALLVVVAVHASGYNLPGSEARAEQRRLARAEDRLLDLLAERRVAWVFGNYWDVYGLNFLSRETIKAIPEVPAVDYHGYERQMGCPPVPFALVSREPLSVAAWARRAGLRGEIVRIDGAFEVFFPAPAPSPLQAPEVVVGLRGFRQGKPRCGPVQPLRARTSPAANRAAPG